MTVSAIVLAAGAGTRMRSERPKPLHRICGRPMVLHVIHALERLHPARTVVVVGHGAEQVTKKVHETAPGWSNVAFVEQVDQNGTGDATAIGMTALGGDDYDDDAIVVVLPGDTPLLRPTTLDELVATHVANANAATLLTSVMDDPTGYGRIVRASDGRVLRIVEQRDAAPDELDIREVCTSIYAFRRDLLGPALRNLTTDNAQGEFYLTDVIEGLAAMGHRVGAVEALPAETHGVNDRWQLALAERELRNRTNRHWLLNGVTMLDPRQTFIDVTVRLGRDVTIYPGTMLHGDTVIADGCDIGPHTQLEDCVVGAGALVRQTVGVDAEIGEGAQVGPFAHLAPGSAVLSNVTTGAFYTASVDD
ncbi:MAG: NTP transferase domain-containing protein [Ilumatobacter sp.]|uniref:bifunctional UDP-N-acetylglucosamine diphosphorylase/glucosamine-1-phosphate N-acetyltransferase GlmU n=1 Tax=Ilumatobacter sp. TaxID=1967498 RepID=UPI0026067E60|nr:NTP transferase domain-containing protein [Ilumatobacter sp.]MDJ0768844.1 NTP transferase domain-containing protein [Ilumatobacter sp.]